MKQLRCGVLAAAMAVASVGVAAEEAKPAPLAAESMPLAATRSVMLDVAESRARAVIVGERGHILVSESRSEWRQVEGVPTRVTLTGVAAAGDKVWAVGHEGSILHSADGGLSWVVQRHDDRLPGADPEAEFDPRHGAPLLDVLFLDESRGFAIGAYSQMLRTDDGGSHWQEVSLLVDEPPAAAEQEAAEADGDQWTFDADELMLDEEADPHLNGIARSPDGVLIVVAERGSAFRSADDGVSWQRIQLPYDGSMFGVVSLGPGHFLAYGLRGHVQESRDGGNSWELLDTGTQLSLMGGAALPDGGVLLVGANGALLFRANAEAPLQLSTFENERNETPVIAGVLPLGGRSFLLCGDKGADRFELPR